MYAWLIYGLMYRMWHRTCVQNSCKCTANLWRKFGRRIFVSPVPLAMHFRRRISFRIVVCILWRFPSKFVVMFMDVVDFVMLRSQTYARRSPLSVLG